MKRRLLWCLTALLGVTLLALLVVSQLTAKFTHTSYVLLSDEAEPCSAVKPQISTSADRNWIAVAWVQENEKADGDCQSNAGRALLRWATEENTPVGWQGPLTVFNPADGDCVNAVAVAVVVTTTAHVVVTVQEPCGSATSSSSVRHRTCDLTTGTCSTADLIYREKSADIRLLNVALTLDQGGDPHVVYNRIDVTSTEPDWIRTSQAWYTRRNSSGDWARLKLGDNAYHPDITWSYSTADDQGYVHVAWETHELQSRNVSDYNGRVRYRRCPDDAETTGGNLDCDDNPNYSSTFLSDTHPRPAIVADGDEVTVFWNRCASLEQNPPCELLALLYERSTNGGWSFADPREVRTNQQINSETRKYDGTDDENQEYLFSLRPAAVASDDGLPVIAWQIENPDYGYYITTTLVTSATENTLSWKETGWSEGDGFDLRVNPVVALPPSAQETEGLHLVFMQSEGTNDNSQIYYSYFGNKLYVEPTPTPDSGEEDNRTYIYLPLIMRNHPGAP